MARRQAPPARGPIASSEELPSVVALWTPPRSECASVPSLDHPTPARSAALPNRLRDARIHRETRDG